MAKKTQIAFSVDMTEKEISAICGMVDGEAPPAAKIALYAGEVLSALAAGSMLLPAQTVEEIRDISPDLDSPDAIVAAIGQNSGIVDGDWVINYPSGTALKEALVQRAETNGITPQQLITDTLDYCLATGVYWDVTAHCRILFFGQEQAAEIGKIIGKEEYTVEDVFAFIKSKSEAPEESDTEVLLLDEQVEIPV